MFKYDFMILLVTIFGGCAGIYYGIENQQPLLTGIGFFSAGAGLCLNGIEDIIRREIAEFKDEYGNSITYTGLSAIFSGIFWCIVGISAICIGLGVLAGLQEELLIWFKTKPSIWMIPGGLACAAFGSHIMLGAREERSGCWAVLGSLPKRVFGFILIVAGLVLTIGGVLEIAAPGLISGLFHH